MVAERVATMNENIPIAQHQAILAEKLHESSNLDTKLRSELLVKLEAEQQAAVGAAEVVICIAIDEYLH